MKETEVSQRACSRDEGKEKEMKKRNGRWKDGRMEVEMEMEKRGKMCNIVNGEKRSEKGNLNGWKGKGMNGCRGGRGSRVEKERGRIWIGIDRRKKTFPFVRGSGVYSRGCDVGYIIGGWGGFTVR